ncbi:MAG: glycosyltransferase [Candidatus Cloacimonetes bacterium]|nr:glycosyltransferase [Candidatus Cloacimonadota bacterium]MDD2506666.1 glycosyltransferase [Candidatus Cloacimonadota bacterium]MDD4560282.1 glycosyltransferase [Candidatus Cloacimonadota bacterium]
MSLVDVKQDKDAIQAMKEEFLHSYFISHSKYLALTNIARNVFKNLPFQVAYYRNKKLFNLIEELAEQHRFDLVYTHLIRMVPYARMLRDSKVILDYTDCISLEYNRSLSHLRGIRKLFFKVEAARTAKYEERVANLFAENWVISPVDIQKLGLKDHHRSVVLPNQVYIPPLHEDTGLKMRLIFTGNMSVAHNIVAAQNVCKKIMPALLHEFPQLEFVIVGAAPVPEIKLLHGVNNTKVLGYVEDLYQALMDSDIFIAPMYFSAGIQNKALEAMACGIPVITTPNVAQSLDAHDEVELMIAEDNHGFVTKAAYLLKNDVARAQIGKSGRALVQKKYSPEAISKLITERVDKIIHSKRSSGDAKSETGPDRLR